MSIYEFQPNQTSGTHNHADGSWCGHVSTQKDDFEMGKVISKRIGFQS